MEKKILLVQPTTDMKNVKFGKGVLRKFTDLTPATLISKEGKVLTAELFLNSEKRREKMLCDMGRIENGSMETMFTETIPLNGEKLLKDYVLDFSEYLKNHIEDDNGFEHALEYAVQTIVHEKGELIFLLSKRAEGHVFTDGYKQKWSITAKLTCGTGRFDVTLPDEMAAQFFIEPEGGYFDKAAREKHLASKEIARSA